MEMLKKRQNKLSQLSRQYLTNTVLNAIHWKILNYHIYKLKILNYHIYILKILNYHNY